jgi:hypothetical protein
VWKTTDFPWARKGYLWSAVLQIILSKSSNDLHVEAFADSVISSVFLTGAIQIGLWLDRKKEARKKTESAPSRAESNGEDYPGDDANKAARVGEISLA